MTHISMGMLTAILSILKIIRMQEIHRKQDIISYLRFNHIDLNQAIELAEKCLWIISSEGAEGKSYFLTDKGMLIISKFDNREISSSLLQHLLFDYALSCFPIWVFRVPSGRKEASLFMTIDEKRCFFEARLLDTNIDNNCIRWWDALSAEIRSNEDIKLLEIGRKAEQLTLQYEKERTGNFPDWRSFDTNLVGYDVLSILSKDDAAKLLIEVKASSLSIQNACMFISSHEWEIAIHSKNYIFHLWSLQDCPYLGIINVDELKPHIPQDTGSGKWKKAQIPYAAFYEHFSPYISLNA